MNYSYLSCSRTFSHRHIYTTKPKIHDIVYHTYDLYFVKLNKSFIFFEKKRVQHSEFEYFKFSTIIFRYAKYTTKFQIYSMF